MDKSIAEKIVTLSNPVWFRSTCEADQVTAPQTKDARQSYYGLIAEEIAAIDPRFAFWSYPEECYEYRETLDANGKVESRDRILKQDATREQMIPDGVQYDRMVVPLLLVVKNLTERIKALEAK